MPQGLQCFDETGKIVVDVTDRQMHLIHTFEISLGSNEYYKDYVYDGITSETHIAFVRENCLGNMTQQYPTLAYHGGPFASIYTPNVVRVSALSGLALLTVDIYRYG